MTVEFEKFKILTKVKPCLIATPLMQPPLITVTSFWPKQKLSNTTRFLWPVGDQINGVPLYNLHLHGSDPKHENPNQNPVTIIQHLPTIEGHF